MKCKHPPFVFLLAYLALSSQSIVQATKGWGTDELRLIKELAVLSPDDRCKLAMRYQELHGQPLKTLMQKECGNRDFGTAIQFLAVPLDEAETMMIHKSCKGLGTAETLLYSIICGRSNNEMDILKKKFFDVYDTDLGRRLDSELSGDFEKLIFHCLQADEKEYDPDFHTEDKVAEDVAAFYQFGQGKFGTDEGGFFKLITQSPPEHLKKVNQLYADKHDITLFQAVKDEMSGKTEQATVFLLGMKLKPYATVAKLLKQSMAGMGVSREATLCVVSLLVCLTATLRCRQHRPTNCS